jgi:signal transduction histidine kinase
VLAVPLFLHDAAVGAICLERSPEDPPFGPDDRELLLVLAHQFPVALEIARLLAEREQLQASLQRAQKMEAVGQLAGGIAHDFNNMLTVMQASLDTVRERGRLDDESAAELALVTSVAQRAAQLTRQLLAFSRHRPVPLSAHDANEVLATLEPMLRRVVGKRVKVVLELAPGLRPVKTDRTSFEQALVNLAVNARDAMPSGGTLTIKTSGVHLDEAAVRQGAPRAGEFVAIAVADTGQGMSTELLDRVFEPFFTTKALGGGTGLGLTTVYAFTKNSGGHVDVWSEVGRGTTFRICLPLAEERVSERAPSASPPVSARVNAETLLVVDDEPFVARSIRRILERQGYRVLVANSAAQGLELAEKHGPEISLAILDVLMPDMTGPELAKTFAGIQLPAKVLYVSGFAPGVDAPVDAEHLLEKPFSAPDLLARVRRLLDA